MLTTSAIDCLLIPLINKLSIGTLDEGGEWVFGSTDLALKSARIVDLCCKSSGFTDFENTADRGSAVIFEADSGLCLSYVRTEFAFWSRVEGRG